MMAAAAAAAAGLGAVAAAVEATQRAGGVEGVRPREPTVVCGSSAILQLVMKADGNERKIALPFSFSYF
jgi:hypothetical protein